MSRREIRGRDPFVTERGRMDRLRQREPSIRDTPSRLRRDREWALDQERFRRLRRRNTVLGLLFAALALFVYFGSRFFTPRLTVRLEPPVPAVVLLNGEESGAAGELIRHISPDLYRIEVKPVPEGVVVEPDYVERRISYGLQGELVVFQTMQDTSGQGEMGQTDSDVTLP